MDPKLERARAELEAAAEDASRVVQTQLQSIDDGIFEEEGGESTADEPGPKVDRLAELLEKLQGLEEAAEEPTATRIAAAEESIREYVKAHPQGG